jgi:hypothetical protein
MKRLADGCIHKFKARLETQGFTQPRGFDVDETYAAVMCFGSLQLLLAIIRVQG